jgi:hypothetical protein
MVFAHSYEEKPAWRSKLRVQPDHYEAFAQALGVADTLAFIKQLMSYYDPVTRKALFGDEKAEG